MAKVILLPEEKEQFVEWDNEWLFKLIKLLNDSGNLDEFINRCKSSEETIWVTTKFGNIAKKFLQEKKLNEVSEDARIIMLSAHCPCHGKTPHPPLES